MTQKERYAFILPALAQEMPRVQTELQYKDPFSLLVAVMLSAQCTDKRGNLHTPALMAAYPTPQKMAQASPRELLPYIASISYPNSKATHLHQTAQMLVEKFGGTVPQTREELVQLPGVGRKTANVMLAVAFGQPAMPVDTHVFRLTHRTGLVPPSAKTPNATEEVLVRNTPPQELADLHHRLILHGRYVCLAQRPKCARCVLRPACKYYTLQEKKKKTPANGK